MPEHSKNRNGRNLESFNGRPANFVAQFSGGFEPSGSDWSVTCWYPDGSYTLGHAMLFANGAMLFGGTPADALFLPADDDRLGVPFETLARWTGRRPHLLDALQRIEVSE